MNISQSLSLTFLIRSNEGKTINIDLYQGDNTIMATLELLCNFMGVDSKKFTKEECLILEAELYKRIHEEFWELFKFQHKDYFYLIKFKHEMENIIMELYTMRCLINDILKSEAYTLRGISYYTQTPEEIIQDLLIGNKINSIIAFPRKLIELHKTIRPEIYLNIIKKISQTQD